MTTKNPLADFKSKAPEITGFSTINHNLRVKLGLNCSEYIIIDYVHNRNLAGKPADIQHCKVRTGFGQHEQEYILNSLIKKGFILPPSEGATRFAVSGKWREALSNIEDEFEKSFWVIFDKEKRRFIPCWPGSKSQAKKNYAKVRKSYTHEFLLQKRSEYFEYLDACHKTGFIRQKMMASVFLGPQERFLEDWKQQKETQLKLHKVEEKPEKPVKAMTMEQVKKLYSENEKNTDK